MRSGSFKDNVTNKLFAYKSHPHTYIYIYVYKQDLELNIPQGLIYHKTQQRQATSSSTEIPTEDWAAAAANSMKM